MNSNLISQLSSFNLLYVEDEDGIRNNIYEILKHMFKNLYLAKNATEAYKLYQDNKPDLIITDIRMPKESGIDLIKRIRKTDSKVRVIITSAYTDLDYMLDATELHLVKYVVKPITEAKLTEALEAFVHSYEKAPLYNLIPSWIYDESKSCVIGPEVEHILTKKENAFLKILINKNRIITYEEMETQIWDDASIMTPNAMRLFIKNFRKKLPDGILKNIQGTGYRLVI